MSGSTASALQPAFSTAMLDGSVKGTVGEKRKRPAVTGEPERFFCCRFDRVRRLWEGGLRFLQLVVVEGDVPEPIGPRYQGECRVDLIVTLPGRVFDIPR